MCSRGTKKCRGTDSIAASIRSERIPRSRIWRETISRRAFSKWESLSRAQSPLFIRWRFHWAENRDGLRVKNLHKVETTTGGWEMVRQRPLGPPLERTLRAKIGR